MDNDNLCKVEISEHQLKQGQIIPFIQNLLQMLQQFSSFLCFIKHVSALTFLHNLKRLVLFKFRFNVVQNLLIQLMRQIDELKMNVKLILKLVISCRMTSPKKSLDTQKESTFFGQLEKVEVQTKKLTNQLAQELATLKNLTTDFQGIEKQGKHSTEQSKTKLLIETKMFEEKIKNYLIAQKAEYMRFANQINAMVANSKQINNHLTLLGTKFDEFQKNVGL